MERNAYHKLAALALPHPEIYSLDDLIKENSAEKFYYLRKKPETDVPQVVSSATLNQDSDLFRNLITTHKIAQIEEHIVSAFGGCLVTQGRSRYMELVLGHLSGLLMHAWHQVSAYMEGNTTCTKVIPQELMVRQVNGLKQTVPAISFEDGSTINLIRTIKGLIDQIGNNLLFEFIIDSKYRMYFVDLKDYPWLLDFRSLFSTNCEKKLIYHKTPTAFEPGQIYDGCFELKSLDQINRNTIIRLRNRAVLCHFVTYSLRRGIAGIMI